MAKKTLPQPKRFSCPYPSFFSVRLSSIFAIILLLASIGFLYAKNLGLEQRYEKQNQPSVLQSPTITTLTPTPKPAVKGTSNPDPIITCSIHANCGGGSRQMKKSECDQTTCCQIGNNWYFYLSKDKCIQDQQSNQPQQIVIPQIAPTTNKVPVFLTYGKYTIYCPSQNVDAVKSIDATMTSKSQEWAKQFNECLEYQRSIDPCYQDCNSKMSLGVSLCIQSYESNTPEYTSCQDKVTNDFLSCTPSCPNPYPKCEYVYSEQKSMSNQISNLCK
jgi:hypothetical protein